MAHEPSPSFVVARPANPLLRAARRGPGLALALIALAASGCAYRVTLDVLTYRPAIASAPACASCRVQDLGLATITVGFDGSGNRISLSTYDGEGYAGYLYPPASAWSAWFGDPHRFEAEYSKTREVSLRITLVCDDRTPWSFVPGKISLTDMRDDSPVELRRFVEFVPASATPASDRTKDFSAIDRGAALACHGRRARTVVAHFDFLPQKARLEFSFADSLVGSDGIVRAPRIRLALTPAELDRGRQWWAPAAV
jgi:hypothetical protein